MKPKPTLSDSVTVQRKRCIAAISTADRYEAFKQRAATIGVLQSCLCAFPVEAEHREWCPSVALLKSQQAVKERCGT
jgi:hypothetical protein